MNAHKIDKGRLQQTENDVTRYMNGNFTFAVICVEEQSARFRVERSLLSTVSNCRDCGPSDTWLGKSHPKSAIISNGKLWNVQGLNSSVLSLEEAHAII